MHLFGPPSEPEMKRRDVFAVLSVIVGCIACCFELLISVPFFLTPRGASIRPMNEVAWIFGFALPAFILGFLPGIGGLFGRRRRAAALGVTLSLAPWFLGDGILRLAMSMRGFTLSP